MSLHRIHLVSAVILPVLLVACGSSTASAPTPTLQGTIDLQITSTSTFTDAFGIFHLVGEIVNNGSGPASAVELSLEIQDSSGNTLLRDELGDPTPAILIRPVLETLAPNQSSPFTYSLDPIDGIPQDYTVTVNGYQYGFSDRADLESQNIQVLDNNQGWYYLTGELVNRGSQWVSLNGLAGGLLDDQERLLSTDWTGIYVSQLAPAGDAGGRDRTPFMISLPNPGVAVSYWRLYWDADWMPEPSALGVGIGITNTYFDQYGAYHLVGWVTSSASENLSVLALAGLYAEDGRVLDATLGQPLTQVDAGQSVPFNLVGFPNVDSNQDQAGLVRTQKVEVDPGGTHPVSTAQIKFDPASEAVSREGSTWLISGSFRNDSDRILSGATVVITVLDPVGNLVAADYNYVLTEESILPGQERTYEVYVFLDPMADLSECITQTKIYGQPAP